MKPTAGKTAKAPQDFESVAKRLGCDPDLKEFDKKLEKVARAKRDIEREKQ